MSFKMRCHTIGLHLKFSTYLQQPLLVGWERNSQTSQNVLLSTPKKHVRKSVWQLGGFRKLWSWWGRRIAVGYPVYIINTFRCIYETNFLTSTTSRNRYLQMAVLIFTDDHLLIWHNGIFFLVVRTHIFGVPCILFLTRDSKNMITLFRGLPQKMSGFEPKRVVFWRSLQEKRAEDLKTLIISNPGMLLI